MHILDKGYNGNVNLKKARKTITWTADMLQEFLRCAEDPIYFAERYIQIVHVDRGLIPIRLYDYQKEIIVKLTNNRRVTVVTSRQAGKTTTAAAIILHYILFNEHKTVALLANKGDAAREILDRIKLSYESLPNWLQQGVVEWNKGSIELENGCKVLAAATSSSAIRGKSISLLYIDECVGGNTFVCVEIGDSCYYNEISSFINIDECNFINNRLNGMIGVIYKTINKINNREYIGLHRVTSETDIICDVTEVGSAFKDGYLGSGVILKQAVIKYKPENFRQEILFTSVDLDEVSKFEEKLVCEDYITRPDTYNCKVGGLNYILSAQQVMTKGDKIRRWISENPEKHAARMLKINKNPEKIEKTAAKHRGKKRSKETCKKISEALAVLDRPVANKGKITVYNPQTGKKRYIDAEDSIPEDFIQGAGKAGPKGRKAHFNPEIDSIKFFIEDEAPPGWILGRK